MKLLFIHTGTKVNQDEEGNLYVNGEYSQDVLSTYENLSKELTVVFKKDSKIYEKEEAKKKFEVLDKNKINVILINDTRKSIKSFISIKLRKENRKMIKEAVENNEKIIIRLPCDGGYIARKYIRKNNKKYMVEVVACIWDALWNYGLRGKILALPNYIKMKKTVKNAEYVVYVTNEFLQKRYKNNYNKLSCSDVRVKEITEKILQNRVDKINNMNNLKTLSIATIGAVDVKYKGQKYVLKAIKHLKNKGYNIKYYLIGNGNKKYLETIAKKYKIEENIIFTGAVVHEEIFEYLDKIDLYIHPSNLEGLCRSIIEAMSRACPIIVSNVGGNTELIKNKKYIFSKKNYREIINIIENLNNIELKAMAKENYENSKKYNSKRLMNIKTNFYEEYIKTN